MHARSAPAAFAGSGTKEQRVERFSFEPDVAFAPREEFLDGSGEVSGAGGVAEPIKAGEAVFWPAGEEHETKTATGLTALIVEGDGLEPFRGR